MFQTTVSDENAALMRVSEFERNMGSSGVAEQGDAGASRLGGLNPSLMQDLRRFERGPRSGPGLDVLEVLAAALRHDRALLLHLQNEDRVMPLAVLPARRQIASPLPLQQLLGLRLQALRVLRVQPAPANGDAALPSRLEPLGPLLWELAMRGARETLLPEIAGIAAYRVTPGTDLPVLELSGAMAAAVERLRRRTTPLREIATWPGFDRERAARLLNGLYLQAALMVSRTHPGAISGGSG
jgi:hypothetical protein